jgi:hypothetical protein
MVLFYNKKDGKIFATIDGRVHSEQQLKCYVDNGVGEENIRKYIIGWIEGNGGTMGYNLDKFELLQKFEDITPESPLDYMVDIESGNLKKLDNKQK